MKKDELVFYKAKTEIFKALGHPTRLWIVESLAVEERCVQEFVDKLNVDFSTVSRHLLVLKQAGIVEDDKRGQKVFYSLKMPCVLNFIKCAMTVIKKRTQ